MILSFRNVEMDAMLLKETNNVSNSIIIKHNEGENSFKCST